MSSNLYPSVETGRIYMHYKGGLYKVLHLSLFVTGEHEEFHVVYEGLSGLNFGRVFSRTLIDFTEQLSDGKYRFTLQTSEGKL